MRFLFGDSVPFEGGYDVLAALRLWVDAAAELLATVDAIESRERGMGKRAQEQLHAINAVEGFFDTVVQRIVEEAARAGEPDLMAPHARELTEHVTAMAAAVREQSAANLDGDQRAVAAEVDGLVDQLAERLGELLLTDPLPLIDWELLLSHADGPAHGRVSLHYAAGIDGRFALALSTDPKWSQPIRIGDVCPDVVLEVGVKKAFLRSTLNPEVAPLDELFLTHLELGEHSMSLRLSRRPEEGETFLIVDVAMEEDSLIGKIRRPGDGSETPHPSPRSDHATLKRLHAALREHMRPLTHHAGVLESVRLDGEARPIRGELVRAILDRVGRRLAPVVMEVHAHSPNPIELSLKREHEDGRREELYLNNDELRQRIAAVPDTELGLFTGIPFLLEGREVSEPDAGSGSGSGSGSAEAESVSMSELESASDAGSATADKPRLELASEEEQGELASVEVDLEAELGAGAEAPADAAKTADAKAAGAKAADGKAADGKAADAKGAAPEGTKPAEKKAEPAKPAAPKKPKAPRRPSAPPRRVSERPSAAAKKPED